MRSLTLAAVVLSLSCTSPLEQYIEQTKHSNNPTTAYEKLEYGHWCLNKGYYHEAARQFENIVKANEENGNLFIGIRQSSLARSYNSLLENGHLSKKDSRKYCRAAEENAKILLSRNQEDPRSAQAKNVCARY
mgnify:CR=1 FL=1